MKYSILQFYHVTQFESTIYFLFFFTFDCLFLKSTFLFQSSIQRPSGGVNFSNQVNLVKIRQHNAFNSFDEWMRLLCNRGLFRSYCIDEMTTPNVVCIFTELLLNGRNMCSIGRESREHIKDQSRAISVCNYRIYLRINRITSPLCKVFTVDNLQKKKGMT